MMNAIVIYGMVIGLGVAATWALGKTFKGLNEEELDAVVKVIQEAQRKNL